MVMVMVKLKPLGRMRTNFCAMSLRNTRMPELMSGIFWLTIQLIQR